MFAELDGELVGLVWVESGVASAPLLHAGAAGAESACDGRGERALLKLVEEGGCWEAPPVASLLAGHQSRLIASDS